MAASDTVPPINPELYAPALPILKAAVPPPAQQDGASAGARADEPLRVCCVVTSPEPPYVIRAANDAWCRTWEVDAHAAVGSTLDVIAGDQSSNSAVRDKLHAASAADGALSQWLDCGTATNYTTSTRTPLQHHLVIGPVFADDGSVQALVAASLVVSARGGMRSCRSSTASAAGETRASDDSSGCPSPQASARFPRRSFRPTLRSLTQREIAGLRTSPRSARSPRTPPARARFGSRAADDGSPEAAPRAPAMPLRFTVGGDDFSALRDGAIARRATRRRQRTLGPDMFMMADDDDEDDEIAAYRAMMQRSDARIVLHRAALANPVA